MPHGLLAAIVPGVPSSGGDGRIQLIGPQTQGAPSLLALVPCVRAATKGGTAQGAELGQGGAAQHSTACTPGRWHRSQTPAAWPLPPPLPARRLLLQRQACGHWWVSLWPFIYKLRRQLGGGGPPGAACMRREEALTRGRCGSCTNYMSSAPAPQAPHSPPHPAPLSAAAASSSAGCAFARSASSRCSCARPASSSFNSTSRRRLRSAARRLSRGGGKGHSKRVVFT